jgi:hypothetical protein
MQDDLTEFQSHNGAIAAPKLPALFVGLDSFNPTMVRLLRLHREQTDRDSS